MSSTTPTPDDRQPAAAGRAEPVTARVLFVEDVAVEAELIAHQLSKSGLAFTWQRVETEGALRAALGQFRPTIVLSDFSLPQFDGLAALRVVRECAPDLPFIFVSGTIGEERAIEALHRGASDYVLKTNLKRLGPAVNRAVNEAAARRERRAIEQRIHDIVDTSQDWIWELDVDRRFVFSSESVAAMLGYSPQQILGTALLDHLHEEHRAAAELSLGSLAPNQRQTARSAYRWRHRDGHYRWLEHNALALIGDDGQVTGFRGAERDVTERLEQESRIARLTRVLQMLSGVNSLVPRIRDRKELLQEASRLAVKTGGYDHAIVLLRDTASQGIQPMAWAGIDDRITDTLRAAVSAIADTDHTLARRVLEAGSVFVNNDISKTGHDTAFGTALLRAGCRSAVALPLVIDKTTIGTLILAARDAEAVSSHELRMLRELAANLSFALQYLQKDSTVRFLSYFNPQTGLARRPLFCERLGRVLSKPADRAHRTAVAILDVEQLSIINDSFGRHIGDLILQHVADRLRRHVQDGETLAQFEGGTFAMMLTVPVKLENTRDALQGVLAAVFGRPFQAEGCELPVRVKSAIAVCPAEKIDANRLVQNAEAALRTAKSSGEKHLSFDAERRSRVVARLTLEHKLHAALEQQQFELHYQPKIDIKTRRIAGVEALIRWRDPEAGLIAPADFIPLLESTGFIVEVGDWVLERAALDCQQWQQRGLPPVRIAVNISPVQLRRPDFLPAFIRLSGAWASDNCGLDIEITEGTLLDDSQATLKKLERLRATGARIAIDDFGTGYSSLSRLADLAIDTLKIDRSFVHRLRPDDRSGKTLVQTIISLARAFDMTVVAEGVETDEQLGMLWEMGCHQSQGYLHSKPITGVEMARLLESGRGGIVLPPQIG